MGQALAVFVGGDIGATLRYWLGGVVYKFMGSDFPIRDTACECAGLFHHRIVHVHVRRAICCSTDVTLVPDHRCRGGFTTFSTFSFETIALLQEGSYLRGTANIVYSILNGSGATWFGNMIGRLL